jgi:hypothetical protein
MRRSCLDALPARGAEPISAEPRQRSIDDRFGRAKLSALVSARIL